MAINMESLRGLVQSIKEEAVKVGDFVAGAEEIELGLLEILELLTGAEDKHLDTSEATIFEETEPLV